MENNFRNNEEIAEEVIEKAAEENTEELVENIAKEDAQFDEISEITEENQAAESAEITNEPEKTEGSGALKEVFEWIQAIVVAVVVAMFLRTFVFTLVNVDGSSMVPTLHNADRLIVWRLGYTPDIDDVIIFRPHGPQSAPYVKRVIALEGQTVNIVPGENGVCDVYVDNVKLQEDYINEKITLSMIGDQKYPVTVPQGHIFVMGDNRNHSLDSRRTSVGVVDVDAIIGQAVFRVWPAGALGKID